MHTRLHIHRRVHTCTHGTHACMREGGTEMHMGTRYRYTRAHAYTLRVPGPHGPHLRGLEGVSPSLPNECGRVGG